MPYSDPSVQKEFLHHYQKEYHQKRYTKRIGELLEYLGGCCAVCGATQELEFDHIDPKSKEFAITSKWTRRWEVLQPELDKCQLLCKEHHLEKTKADRWGIV